MTAKLLITLALGDYPGVTFLHNIKQNRTKHLFSQYFAVLWPVCGCPPLERDTFFYERDSPLATSQGIGHYPASTNDRSVPVDRWAVIRKWITTKPISVRWEKVNSVFARKSQILFWFLIRPILAAVVLGKYKFLRSRNTDDDNVNWGYWAVSHCCWLMGNFSKEWLRSVVKWERKVLLDS